MKNKSHLFIIILSACFFYLDAQEFNETNKAIKNKPRIGILFTKDAKDAWSLIVPLMELFFDKSIQAIILALEEGITYGTAHALAQDIIKLKNIYRKPVIAYAENSLVAARYLLACAADRIVISPVTEVGHLGIFASLKHLHEKNLKEGILLHVVHSGKFKTSIDPNVAPNRESIEREQKLIIARFDQMVKTLLELRPSLSDSKSKWITGERFSAAQAVEDIKLADVLGDKLDLIHHTLNTINYPKLLLSDIDFVTKRPVKDSYVVDFATPGSKSHIGILKIDTLGDSTWDYAKSLLELFADNSIEKIILAINCRGGHAYTACNLHHEIKKLKHLYNKPVLAYINDYAFSGGYYIATAADYIIASAGSQSGSIGVRRDRWDYTKKNSQELITYTPITTGSLIDLFDYNTALTAEGKESIQKGNDAIYKKFIADVEHQRPALQIRDKAQWAEAQVYAAQESLELGLIDQMGSVLDVLQYTNSSNKQVDIDKISLIFKTLPAEQQQKKKKKKRSGIY